MSSPRATSWILAIAALYAPALIPLAGVGPLNECPHCVRIYLFWFPALPGAMLASPLRTVSEWLFITAALAFAACLAWALTRAWQGWNRTAGIALLVIAALLSAFNALAFAAALRI